jgi:TetR/AcrR family transcriptional regulator, repressor for uid operon
MTDIATVPTVEPLRKSVARSEAILDAAQEVFIHKGFALATMQDIASACGMSAGNLYRYFPSKAAVIAGLVERDRNDVAEKFARLAHAPDQVEGFEAVAREYFKQEAARKAPLTLEIWAAASRMPEIRAICSSMESAVCGHLAEFLSRADAEGKLAPDADRDVICHLILGMAEGIIRNVALHPDSDIDRELDIMFATLRAAFAGHIRVNAN